MDDWLFQKQDEEPIEARNKLPEFRQWEKGAPRTGRSSLGSAARKLIEALGLTEKFLEQQAVTLWPEVVGSRIAAVSEAQKITDGVLTVKVNNSAWKQELHYLRASIAEKLNRRLRKEVVKEIRLV